MKGFSIIELVISVTLMLLFAALGFPAYRENLATRGAQGAARLLEAAIRERKERAVALGESAGLCLGQNNLVRLYEIHPFLGGGVTVSRVIDLGETFGVPVSASAVSAVVLPGTGACTAGESDVVLTASPDPISDWQGTITLQAGLQIWRIAVTPGGMVDSH